MDIQRKKEADQVKEIVSSYLLRYKRSFPTFIQNDNIMWNLLEDKMKIAGIRSYIAYKLYTLSGGKNWEKILGPFLGMIEMSIVSTYATNRIFDQKKYGKEFEEIVKGIIASALAREGLYYILYSNHLSNTFSEIPLWHEISEIQRWFYLGQYINSFKIKLPQIIEGEIIIDDLPKGFLYVEKEIPSIKFILQKESFIIDANILENFLKNQFFRLYLINSHFYERIAVISVSIHKKLTEEQKSLLTGFGALYGVGSQIINDIIDFSLPSWKLECLGKTTDDFFNDLKNGLFTFPVFFGYFSKKQGQIKELLLKLCSSHTVNKNQLTEKQMAKILIFLLDCKAIQLSLKIASLFLKRAEYYLEQTSLFEIDSALRDVFEIVKHSKFIVKMFKWYRNQKKKISTRYEKKYFL